jgi:hypothetical protein
MIVALLSCSYKLCAEENSIFTAEVDIERILAGSPTGTPAREENEFKLTASGAPALLANNTYILGKIRSALESSFNNSFLWQAPAYTGSEYYIMQTGLGTFCFLDIYLDTDDWLNLRHDISYRVRYRWHSRSSLFRYLLGSRDSRDFPHRCEYQLKVYEKEWQEGFNNCLETRFEYRNDSFPFKSDKSAPPPPWPFEEYIKPAISGKYKNHDIYTTHEYARVLKEKFNISGKIRLKPSLAVVTTRRRIHLGIKNEFGLLAARLGMGSAGNADQSILATLDTSEIHQPDFLNPYLYSHYALRHHSLTPRLVKRLKNSIKPVKIFTELEFEFERNIESALGHATSNAKEENEKNRLLQIKQAFLADVKRTSIIVAETLNKIGISTRPGTISKYRQAGQAIASPTIVAESDR